MKALATRLGLLLLCSGPALADPHPFTTLARCEAGPPGEERRLVFDQEAELVTTVLAQTLDPDPDEQIDWRTHQVIAVRRASIDALELDPSGDLVVRYSDVDPTTRGDGSLHMVLCPRTGRRVRFEQTPRCASDRELVGEVQLLGPSVRLKTSEGTFEVQPAQRARDLQRFPGRTVRVQGQVRGPTRDAVLEVSKVLSPEWRRLEGVAHAWQGRPQLLLPGLPPVRISGPAQSAVHAAVGAQIECLAYVFTTPHGQPVEAYVESVKGTAVQTSTLWNSAALLGSAPGTARAGEDLQVVRAYGLRALVRNADGDQGWVHINRVRIGQPLLVPPSSPGLVSAVERD